MANINSNLSDYVRFWLVVPGQKPLLVDNMIGWDDYGYDAARNMDYHGTLNKVTKTLGFRKDAKDLIYNEYLIKGILATVALIRTRLKDVNGEIIWIQDDPVWADFNKMTIENDTLNLNFYSNSLMDLVESHEDDEFEIERLETIDNVTIESLEELYVEIKGRSLQAIGESRFVNSFGLSQSNSPTFDYMVQTELISEGPTRHSAQTSAASTNAFPVDWTALNMFYDNSTTEEPTKTLTIKFDIPELFLASKNKASLKVYKWNYNELTASYDLLDEILIFENVANPSFDYQAYSTPAATDFIKTITVELEYTNSLSVGWTIDNGGPGYFSASGGKILLSEVAFFEPSPSIRFNFYYDVLERLMYILTGKKETFISSWLGRIEKGYEQDGEGGLLGFVSGLWMRNFRPGTDRYKSPKISLKNALESVANCFNLGYGVENINNTQKLVVEELAYFYRDEIVGSFPYQIKNEKFSIDERSFHSRLEFGFEKGGELEQQMGLDEPNIKSQYITPVNKSRNKFVKISKVRADEYKLEDLRRQPQESNPNDSLSGDEDNWYLDLKRSEEADVEFEQVQWEDRLTVEPTGIHDPDSFRSMWFTPRAILFRMAKNFKSGIYLYKERFINFISSSSNVDLSMQFIGETRAFKESDNIKIGDLDRPIFKNEKITFTHPWNDDVEELIFGKTEVIINGQKRLVPNYYFKMEFQDEKGNTQRGYFLKFEYDDNPTFEFQLANEEII